MTNQFKKWEFKAHNYQIADTGDYDGHYEITNGINRIIIRNDFDDAEEVLNKICDIINENELDIEIEDHSEEAAMASDQVDRLQTQIENQAFKEITLSKTYDLEKIYINDIPPMFVNPPAAVVCSPGGYGPVAMVVFVDEKYELLFNTGARGITKAPSLELLIEHYSKPEYDFKFFYVSHPNNVKI